jgi:class 3 adenylate cyclase
MSDEAKKIAVTSAEILNIQSYIQKKNTAVLTVMFTDIKGFTELTEQKGEQYASEFRSRHDEILTEVIETDGAGLIIKFIGDAVMAVFSEPSVAVERALQIQQRLAELNASQQFSEPMKVRIGLHIGQVSVANTLQADVFGRHVNRAARIESLADGGQIYLSYPVFDSAKGWLVGHDNLCWQSHGFYQLKGIEDAVEIYEVIAREHGKPKPPLHGKKQRPYLARSLYYALALIVVTVASTAAFFYYQKPTVHFVRFYPDGMYLDNAQVVSLAGQKTDSARRLLNNVTRGKHIVFYSVTDSDRYYADFTVDSGVNNVELKFKESRLPSLQKGVSSLAKESKLQDKQTFNYVLYDKKGEAIAMTAELSLVISSYPDGDSIRNQYEGSLVLNGKHYDIASQSFSHLLSDHETKRLDPVLLYEDDYHAYYYKAYALNTHFEFEVYGVFKPVVQK